jgi:hypothetical protein
MHVWKKQSIGNRPTENLLNFIAIVSNNAKES